MFRYHPFTIILKDPTLGNSVTHPHRLKIDAGAKVTGIALVRETDTRVVWAAEIHHRGDAIRRALATRCALRRGRRYRRTRYRKPRFLNRHPAPCVVCSRNARHGHPTCRAHARRRPETSCPPRRLPPSLESRVRNAFTWAKRLMRWIPVTALSVEVVRFDTQLLQNPEIEGVMYQQGELAEYEVREYLLEKFGRTCVYCRGGSGDPVLEVEHVVPKSRGGTDRVSNLVIACRTCNQAKGNRTAEECGHPEVQDQARQPLRDAAAVNSTRWTLHYRLRSLGLPIEAGTGGRTKYNRTRHGYPKAHWIDAACVGETGATVRLNPALRPLVIRATGHGTRRMQRHDRHGFPVGRPRPRRRRFLGFATGDIVLAVIPQGKYAGRHIGRVAIRHRPSFDIERFRRASQTSATVAASGRLRLRGGSSPGLTPGAPAAAMFGGAPLRCAGPGTKAAGSAGGLPCSTSGEAG